MRLIIKKVLRFGLSKERLGGMRNIIRSQKAGADDKQRHKTVCYPRVNATPTAGSQETAMSASVRLDQWIKYHKGTLLVTAIHALQPPIDLLHAAGSVLRILLIPRQNEVVPGKYFMICTAWVDTQLDVIELGGQWEAAMRQFPRKSWQHE